MSQENVEMVRRGFDAYNRGDLDAVVADFASDCEYVPSGSLPGGRDAYRGPEGYKRFIGWLRDEFEDARLDVNDVIDAGDRVLASLTVRGRGRQSGVAASWDLWQVWTIRDSSIVRGQASPARLRPSKPLGCRSRPFPARSPATGGGVATT
jgi:ketosteroid isomerase-like protein